MKAFAKTDIGKVRQNNQDFYYMCNPEESIYGLYIVADGMGGYNGGDIASSLATDAARKYIENNFYKVKHDKESLKNLITDAVEHANKLVYERSKENEQLEGMGTTLEVCLIYNNRAYIGHVGDSRIYRIRNNIIRKLTTDHSYVERLVKAGNITKEEAAKHPKKNMLTKALGCTNLVEPDVTVKGFLKDDVIVMTTDGLTNMVKDEEIYYEVRKNPQNAANELVEKANLNGGYDNITTLIIINN